MVGTRQDVADLTDFMDEHVNPPAASAQKPMQTAQR